MHHPRYSSKNTIFLTDSFGLLDLKNFIISDDNKIIYKILFVLELFKLSGGKLNVMETNLLCYFHENFNKGKKGSLGETEQILFNSMIIFAICSTKFEII